MIKKLSCATRYLLAAGFLLAVTWTRLPAAELSTGSTTGVFTNPVLAGNFVLLDNTLLFADNTTSAVYNGFGTNAIQWGSSVTTPASGPDYSSVVFVGANFSSEAPGVPFRLGTLTYTNGNSDSPTAIFGGTLIITAHLAGGLGAPIDDSTDAFDITGTQNGHANAAQDSDFLNFTNLHLSFNVLEGKTASADVYGEIVGDPQLVLTGLVATSEDGFIGNGTTDSVPEPGTFATLGASLFLLFMARGWWLLRNKI